MASKEAFARYTSQVIAASRLSGDSERAATLDKASQDFVEGVSALAGDADAAGATYNQLAGLLGSLKGSEKNIRDCTLDALAGKSFDGKTDNGIQLRCSVDAVRNTYTLVAVSAAAEFELQIPLLA